MKRKILAVILGLGLGLGVTEVFLRYFNYQEINLAWNCYEPDLTMHYVYQPGSKCRYKRFGEYDTEPRINNVGLRSDSDTIREKPIGVKRILILGDSLVAAHEVEEKDTFVKLLENQWRTRGLPVEVLNGGIRGYAPLLSYFYLKFRALELKPDVVILLVSTADFADNRRYQRYARYDLKNEQIVSVWPEWNFYYRRLESAKTAGQTTDAVPVSIGSWLKQWWPSRSLRVIKVHGRVAINSLLGRPLWYGQLVIGDWRTDPVAIERDNMTEVNRQLLMEEMQNIISQTSRLLRQNQVKFYLALMPMGYEISEQEWNLGRVTWGLERNRLYEPTSLRELGGWARGQAIEVIDLIPALRQPHEELYFFPKDGHLTIAGHEEVAIDLERALEKGVD